MAKNLNSIYNKRQRLLTWWQISGVSQRIEVNFYNDFYGNRDLCKFTIKILPCMP